MQTWEDDSDSDGSIHGEHSFWWGADDDLVQSDTQTGERSSSSSSSGAFQAAANLDSSERLELDAFIEAWQSWRLTGPELQQHFGYSERRVRELRARCREVGLVAPAESSRGGPVAPTLPPREQLEAMWLDGRLQVTPVAAGLDALAARLGVTTGQLREHFRKVGFEPKHPVPEEDVKAALCELLARPWCHRLGPTFAGSELRRNYSWCVRPALVERLLAELDPTGKQRGLKKFKHRRKRPQYSVAGPRSLYHADAHEKLAHLWGVWFHGCVDGYSRKCIYVQARDNKRAHTVRDCFVAGCNAEGWPSRCRWDKGSENHEAIREQVNRHYDPARPETGQRGSAITGVSMDNSRIESFWRFVREQVTDEFGGCFEHMRHTLRGASPYLAHTCVCYSYLTLTCPVPSCQPTRPL